MIGWLVVNEFLQSNKFNEIHNWLQKAAHAQGISLLLKTNAQLLVDLTDDLREQTLIEYEQKPDFILFWDKDVRLASHLEMLGYPVFNSSKSIEICDDKSLTHQVLYAKQIPMARTIIGPKTFNTIGYTNDSFLITIGERLGYPMVVKECFGSFGQQVYLAHSLEDLKELLRKIGAKPVIFQEFIQSSAGKDIRINVVGGEVIASMYRYSTNGDFRANVSIGGSMKMYHPSKEEIELAIQSCEAIGVDFAGVDILFGVDGRPLVCEVNSNAHFKSIFQCTGINVADSIISHIKNSLNNSI